ncbi:MAG: hypothetical protein Q4A49_01315 [Neisseria sp.]|nr:hypothetical protein [Neisseria sp.]
MIDERCRYTVCCRIAVPDCQQTFYLFEYKMKKILTVLLVSLPTSSFVIAKPVKTIEQAVSMVTKSVEKNNLTPLKSACLMFMKSGETKHTYMIDVRENHNEQCGGDPETAPRLMSYEVNRQTGKMCTDSVRWAERLKAQDPYDFQCRPIK